MKIRIKAILQKLVYDKIVNNINENVCIDINNIYTNSNEVVNDSIFIALIGQTYDAHRFIDQAIENGSIIIICSHLPNNINKNVSYIQVKDTRKALEEIISILYQKELSKIKIIGITGTNGKTTTSTLLYQLFKQLGYKVGLISTINVKIDNEVYDTKNTTPDILSVNKFLYKMVDIGCQYAFMEVSSHALIQERVKNINFDITALTNITHDHLDYHKTFNNYIQAKKILFDKLSSNAIALVNKDDKHYNIMLQNTKALKKTYSIKNIADFKLSIIESNLSGMKLCIDNTEVWVKLVGLHNAYNILLVYSIAIMLDQNKEETLKHISTLDTIKGRCEINYLNNGVIAIIDYAHTPDGIKNILESINHTKQKHNNIIAVVGAGGNRDEAKRPKMAYQAYTLSNYLILTSDNPRDEDPQKIIDEMKAGLPLKDHYNNLEEIIDRKKAIIKALSIAKKNDIVVILGKGHEEYIDIQGQKIYFSETEVIKEFNNNIIA